jgi:hypothetical protein
VIKEITRKNKQFTNRLAYMDQPVHPQPAPLTPAVAAEATAPLTAKEEEAPRPADEAAAEEAAPPPPPAAPQSVDFVILEPLFPSDNQVLIIVSSLALTYSDRSAQQDVIIPPKRAKGKAQVNASSSQLNQPKQAVQEGPMFSESVGTCHTSKGLKPIHHKGTHELRILQAGGGSNRSGAASRRRGGTE